MRNLRVGIWTQNIAETFGGGPGYYAELVECISKSSFTNADICFIGEDKLESIQIGKYKYYSVRNIRTKKFLFLKIAGSVLSKLLHINSLSKIYYKRCNMTNLMISIIINGLILLFTYLLIFIILLKLKMVFIL